MTTIAEAGIKATAPLLPESATVLEVIEETPTIRSFRLMLDRPGAMERFSFLPGQIGQLSVMGTGEATFAISSPPSQKEYIQFSIMKTGTVTSAIHELTAGDTLPARAPMGCAFPTGTWKGKNVLLVAGGIGMAPLRSLFLDLLDHRGDYGDITLIYGARSPADLCFAKDRRSWQNMSDVDFIATIDSDHPEWTGSVGMVPSVLEEHGPGPRNTVAITCGPPVMIKYTLLGLEKMGYREEQVFTTIERRMKCGIGICGRCNLGAKYVCTDGPVFSLEQLKELPDEF